ncbi:MAG: methyltransferase domain-containing protein [Pseudomonadota bacterium]
MGLLDETNKTLGRARYAAAQGLRSAWYSAHYTAARRRAGGFNRPGEAPFRAEKGPPDTAALRRAFLDLFVQDRRNVEDGLYPAPNDVRLRDLGRALRSSRAFLADVPEVDRRRVARDGAEVRAQVAADRFPAYYRQNFHYQSDGWLSDDSARIYDTQVETLFAGAADAMRRAALAEIARELKGRDQRQVALLDVACGTGRFLAQILSAYPKLQATGLDLSPNYAEKARRAVSNWAQADIVEGAAEAMPIEDASQDLVVSVYLFHELPPRVRPAVFEEIARVLKPGGLFVFADSLQFGDNPALDGLLEYFPEGFHEPYYKGYLKADLAAEIEAAGFVSEGGSTAFLTKIARWRRG